jgi:hypothetical protein
VTHARWSRTDWIAVVIFSIIAIGAYLRLCVSVGLVRFMDEQCWVTAATCLRSEALQRHAHSADVVSAL